MINNWNYKFRLRKKSKAVLNVSTILFILFLQAGSVYCQESANSTSLFDGKTLTGWKTVNPANQELWYVEDSVIMAGNGIDKIQENTYLYTEKEYDDFEFRTLFRLTGDPETGMINSGIQYRSIIHDHIRAAVFIHIA